jgi:hypothetical protein
MTAHNAKKPDEVPVVVDLIESHTQSQLLFCSIGMDGSGRTLRKMTSYADILSVATNSRWSGDDVS